MFLTYFQLLIYLFITGITRKCLNGWVNGGFNFRTKLSGHQINLLSEILENCNLRRPYEIHRAIRRLDRLKHWKGTEYRTFLLYLGPVVLKDFLDTQVYHHFLTLFSAITIVSCESYLTYIDVADQLIKDYIHQFKVIYGRDSVSSNVHNLCHLTEDVKKFGPLFKISSYKFENFLGYIKSLLRSGNKPLSQIAKRMTELNEMNNFSATYLVPPKNTSQKIHLSENCILSSDLKNKWFLTKTKEIIGLTQIIYKNGIPELKGIKYNKVEDFFVLPIRSSFLNIFTSTLEEIGQITCSLDDVKCKLFSVKYHRKCVFFPLLHTVKI